jgi:hypothetical protein
MDAGVVEQIRTTTRRRINAAATSAATIAASYALPVSWAEAAAVVSFLT